VEGLNAIKMGIICLSATNSRFFLEKEMKFKNFLDFFSKKAIRGRKKSIFPSIQKGDILLW